MSRHFIRDGIQKLVFPWLTPHPTKTDPETGTFQLEIRPADYLEMSKRNQVAFNIIYTVAEDAITGGFRAVSNKDEPLEDFDALVQPLYKKQIKNSLLVAYARARLYGSAAIFIGFDDTGECSKAKKYGSHVKYIYALPENVISARNEKQENGLTAFPLELDSYSVAGGKDIDASRIIHVQPFSIADDFKGSSRLEPVYDTLTILKNSDWSIGQNIFRNSTGLTFIIAGEGSKQAQMNAIRDSVTNVNAKSIAVLPPKSGVAGASSGSVDPKSTYDVLMGQISAGSNIPVSILTGAQSGQGVSENDRRDYADFLSGLREATLTDVVTNMLELYQQSGQLPKQEFKIKWNSRSIFLIEESRAKLYDARTEVEQVKLKEVKARGDLFAARAKYWADLTDREKAKFEEGEEKAVAQESRREEGGTDA